MSRTVHITRRHHQNGSCRETRGKGNATRRKDLPSESPRRGCPQKPSPTNPCRRVPWKFPEPRTSQHATLCVGCTSQRLLMPVLWVDWRERGRQDETSAKPVPLNTRVVSHTFSPTQPHFSCCRRLAVQSFFVWLSEPTSDVGNVLSLELAARDR